MTLRRNLPMSLITLIGLVVSVFHASAFTADKADTDSFTFVQMCDPQLGFGGYEHDIASFERAVKQINALKPDFVVICGDLVNRPDDRSFADFKRIKESLDMPCYCAPGNHDVGNTLTIASLDRYRKTIGDDYYSFVHKGYTFVVTNTQLWKAPLKGESSTYQAWVTARLKEAKSEQSPVFIISHHPLFLKTPDEKDQYYNLPLNIRTELLTLYTQCGVVAVLGGHTHRTIINDFQGIQLVNAEATSKNFDTRPLGFRRWHVASPTSIRHEFIPLTTGKSE